VPAPAPSGLALRAAAAAQVFVADPTAPVLDPGDRHHLARVLRLRQGETVIAADGAGTWVPCEFGAGATLRPLAPPVAEPAVDPADRLTVAFAPVKGDRPEWVVQKLTEIGIDRIVPLATDRSVVRWDAARAAAVAARLGKVAREAAAQARRVRLPEIAPVGTLAGVMGPGAALAHYGAPPLRDAAPGAARWTTVAVGPEGGWSPAELAAGYAEVGLGDGVLRAETAAVVGATLLAAMRESTR
jgi:16S rRNA (uracil1498-N3)-methyltransferase